MMYVIEAGIFLTQSAGHTLPISVLVLPWKAEQLGLYLEDEGDEIG